MKIVIKPQEYAVYIFFFSLNFETMNLFNLGIDYLASKISISILLIISLLNFKSLFSLKHFSKYLTPILIYFALLTVVGFENRSFSYSVFFDFPFFLNILIFLILINYSRIEPDILLKGLFVFALSTFILSLLYFIGVGVTDPLEGRYTVFGMNQNLLGLSLCISLFILMSIIFENRLELGKYRYFLLLLFPFLFIFMISTGSRVAFISFSLGILTFFFFNKCIRSIKKVFLIIFAFPVFVLFWQLFLKNSLVIERLFSSVKGGDFSNRDMIWIKLFDIISNNFFWGVGKTGYGIEMDNFIGDLPSPHNVILEVLCYTGIIGLLIFLIFFIRIAVKAFKKYKYKDEILSLVLLIPILGMILSGQIFEQKFVWGLFAFIASSSTIKAKVDKMTV